jgi:hypothetical protein
VKEIVVARERMGSWDLGVVEKDEQQVGCAGPKQLDQDSGSVNLVIVTQVAHWELQSVFA